MRKLFSGLFLFLLSGVAFAGSSSFGTSGLPTPVSSHTDLSIAYLSQVFGTVGNSLQGTSGQMLGMLFSKLNEGILVVAGMWLIYTVVTIVLRSAMDGSFMGPNKNVFWIIIRIALAFAMLIPGPMTGYNVIQDIVMKVVVEGVSLADQTWNYGLSYITAGGTLWHTPETTSGSNKTAIVTQKQASTILSPARKIFLNEVCMVKSSMLNQNSSQNSNSGGIANTGSAPINYTVVPNDNKTAFYFPGIGNTANFSSNLSGSNPGTSYCGSVSWKSIPDSGCSHGKNSMACTMSKAAVSQMVYDLLPAAQAYVCSQGNSGPACAGVSGNNIVENNSNDLFSALVNYVNAAMPIAQRQSESAKNKAQKFIPDAMKAGWMMAGRYYWDLSQIQAYYKNVKDVSKYIPSVNTIPEAQGNKTVLSTVDSAKLQEKTYKAKALKLLSHYSTASGAGNTGKAYPEITKTAGNKILNLFLSPIVGDIVSLFALFGVHGGAMGMGPDPILFLHNVGMECMSIAGDIWIGLAIVLFAAGAATTVCQSSLNLSTPLNEVSNWIKPPLMVLAAALLGVGVLLGYYVPLYPFMLFTFGVIGWIIAVIEAMVAAPLIAFGLTHPEGHDFLGEAKQGLMLLLSVFLRPVLMVIGLIAGMILSYVSLRILVYTYSGFLQDLFYTSSSHGGDSGSVIAGAMIATKNIAVDSSGLTELVMSLFCFPLLLAVFAGLVYVVTTQCFSLIYVLPDYILRWIGGPQQSSMASNPAQLAGQIQGEMGQMAKVGGEMSNQSLGGLEKNIEARENKGQGGAKQGDSEKIKTKPEGGEDAGGPIAGA